MHQLLRRMWREEDGQDLVEYTLLIAFCLFVTVGVVSIAGASIAGIVHASNAQLAEADRVAGGR